jgi:hypothetical protein
MNSGAYLQRFNVTNEVPGWGQGLRKVGDAIWLPEGYSVIRLNLFPRAKYFLRPHPVRVYEYVLYSRRDENGLSQPVGRGEVVQGTGYIQVQFLDVKINFFLQFLRSVNFGASAA